MESDAVPAEVASFAVAELVTARTGLVWAQYLAVEVGLGDTEHLADHT